MEQKALAKAIEVKTKPAVIEADFAAVRAAIEANLEKFDGMVISPDSIKDGKKMVAEIGAISKELEAIRKAVAAEASAPVKAFEAQMKELKALNDDAKAKISEQVEAHEAVIKEKIGQMLEAELVAAWTESAVDIEFRNATTDGLILLGNMTAGGKLTKGARDEITRRVSADKSLQQQTELRLARLEADSYKAGLAAPLNKAHVEPFLFADDATYQEKLQTLMESEIQREEQAVAAHEKRMEKTAAAQAASVSESVEQTPPPAETVAQDIPRQPQTKPNAGEVMVSVTARFDIQVSASVPTQAVIEKVKGELVKAGFTSLVGITADRMKVVA